MYRTTSSILSIALSVLLCACAGPAETTGQSSGPAPDDVEDGRERVSIAEYETFDPSQYPIEPVQVEEGIAHEVPERLLQARAEEGIKQEIEGFRVQVFSAQDQTAAQEFRESVRQWWEEARADAPDGLFQEDPPLVIIYSQPYYRVRFGAFADRDEAEEALAFVQSQYPGAFVARGTVTVVR